MSHRSVGIVFVVAAFAIGFSGWIASAQEKSEGVKVSPAAAFKPVQPMEELMEGHKKLFGEVREGIVDEKWDEAATSAWILAELANVNHFKNTDTAYQGFADRLSAKAVDLAKALKKKDGATSKRLVGEVGKTCKDCHNQYKKD